ncbi:Stk1 family PASTA domain-containing Ser/Thr kinase [Cellulosilyticum ruminicola]|uniref:Stk1 family PASTA domain-containing Ser/Thr kinase n=1 Tax=Cellulosilyticum ruminicola TaxID=425254 RepID=UPI0006D0325A|nr:Stk1 family PASTA domain-containing Ser/Thr kinase [Cellulosilyticum ruminicola]
MLMPGVLLGERYEVIEKIGAGGMSIVYKARDNRLQRYVAIKELREEFAKDEEFVAKFRKEALAAASLSHPNIVGIYDVGSDRDTHYIVMEYIEGKTLKELISEEGPFNSKQVLELGKQIVSALKHAHSKRIIHRDIKPQNILITNDHVLKVTDFGIAKAVDSSTIVASSNAIGSVHYFSPEQAKGKYVNVTSDLYSCGIVLFELATKRLPFEADTHISIALKHINEDMPKPSLFNPSILPGLEGIILKATDKRQDARYQNADEMLADMDHVLIDPEYHVKLNTFSDETILLSPEETAFIRNNARDEEPICESINMGAGLEAKAEPKAPVEEKSIYEDKAVVKQTFKEDEQEEVSNLYKILVSVGGVLATLSVLVVIILAITLWNPFSSGGKLVSVPNVKGRTVDVATKTLKSVNLKIEVKEEVTNEAEPGIIFEQTPGENTRVKKHSIVIVTVAAEGSTAANQKEMTEVKTVRMPDVEGLSREAAQSTLRDMNLKVRFEPEESSRVEKDYIIRQDPSADIEIEEGSTVVLTISIGTSVKMARVPNLVQLTLEKAQKAAQGSGLNVTVALEEYSDKFDEGLIINQSIEAYSEVSEGTTISVVVSKGKEPVLEEIQPPAETEETNTTPIEEPAQDVTQSVIINLPNGVEEKESYRVLAKFTTQDGNSSYVIDREMGVGEFPTAVSLTSHGTGKLEVYVDDMTKPAYTDNIYFN